MIYRRGCGEQQKSIHVTGKKNLRRIEGRTDYSDAKFVTAIVFHPRSQASGKLVSTVPCFLVPNTPVFFCSVNLHFGWSRRAEYPRKFTSERILTQQA